MAVEDSVDFVPQLQVISSRRGDIIRVIRGEVNAKGSSRVVSEFTKYVASPRKILALRKACLHEEGRRAEREEGGWQAGRQQ